MRTNLTKVLGISMLAIVGILAVNASAAHAALTWQLLKNGSNATNNLLNLKATLPEGELLVPGLSLTINCTGGSANAHLVGGATLEGSASASFAGCTVLKFPKCEVHSPGAAVGTINASGEGLGKLAATPPDVIVLTASGAGSFTEIIIENELCPFNETEAEVTGGATIEVLEALKDLKEHLCHLNDDALKFGGQEAFLDGASGSDTILFNVKEESGGTWAIHHNE